MARAGRVLVVQPAFLGDVVFTSALVDALAERFAEVDVCVTPRGHDAALAMPRAARVHVFDKRGEDKGPSGLWRTARRLREQRYDAAALPHRSPRSALLTWLAGIPRRVGFRGAPGSPLYTERVAEPAGSFVAREGALARAFGAEPRPMRLAARPEWVRAAEERLRGWSAPTAAASSDRMSANRALPTRPPQRRFRRPNQALLPGREPSPPPFSGTGPR